LKLRIATSESYLDRNRERQERTEWHSVTVWGKRAEALAKFLTKGSRVFIEGGLRTSSYDDKEGNKRYKTEVNATNIILCGGRSAAPSGETAQPSTQTSGGGFDDADYGASPGGNDDFPF
jgi:single-strand DNA-binding protein